MADYKAEDFITLYPGKYTEREEPYVKKYYEECEAINQRGNINIQDLISGKLPENTPGIGPVVAATEAMIRYNNSKYDPENPLYHDAEYAKELGYKDILAFFTYAAHDDTFTSPYPPEARDTLLVSQLSHRVSALAPIYPGDTLYLVFDQRTFIELTPPEGSIYRTIAQHQTGSIYNQHGEKVNEVEFSTTESIRIFKEGLRPEHMGFPEIWEAPDWNSRPQHYYTDDDYDYIRSVWKNEYRQGNVPLYWEDVHIGDKPAITADGPVIESVLPTAPYGQGIGGTRTMKKEILDESIFSTMIRRPDDGIYVLRNKDDYTPKLPDGAKVVMLFDDGRKVDNDKPDGTVNTADIHSGNGAVDTSDIHSSRKDERAAIINFFGRDTAIRHIHNWIGDYGKICEIHWSIMPPETHAAYGKPVPVSPFFRHFIQQVPELKGRTVDSHGLTTDMAFVHSYVVNKYIKNGHYMVKLVWWIEEIEHHIWIEGDAEVELPSRK